MASIAKEERGTLPDRGSWVQYFIRGKPRSKVMVAGTPKEGFYIQYVSGSITTSRTEPLTFGWNKSRVKAESEARKWIRETKPGDLYNDAYEQASTFALHHE